MMRWQDRPVLHLAMAACLFHAGVTFGQGEAFTYGALAGEGIVSGFHRTRGNPLGDINKVKPIGNPKYVAVRKGVYDDTDLCVGVIADKCWRFAPVGVMNMAQIVNHSDQIALCYCPLSGLCISMEEILSNSGLYRYDTFTLYNDVTSRLILPFTQRARGAKERDIIPYNHVEMLNYAGVRRHFPKAGILDPRRYRSGHPYGRYAENRFMGIGHDKPGLTATYSKKKMGYHPKERVLLAGFRGIIQKGYPLAELKKQLPKGGSFQDKIGPLDAVIYFYPQYNWATARGADGKSINCGYAYIFALYQNLPKLPLYRAKSVAPK